MDSKSFSLNGADLVSLGKNALLVAGAAGLTYVASNLGNLDLGATGALIVPVVTVVLDSLIKWMKDNSK
jgi:hypothetical protein